MAKRKTKAKKATTPKLKRPSFKLSNQQKLIFGSFLIIFGILLCIAFLSFFFTGDADQSLDYTSRDNNVQNWLNKSGHWLSDFFIRRGFGIASFIFSGLVFLSGIYVLMDIKKAKLRRHWFWGTLIVIWFSILFGFFNSKFDVLGGTIGFEMNTFLQDYIGKIGTLLFLIFGLITYLAIRFKVTAQSFIMLFKSAKKNITDELNPNENEVSFPIDNDLSAEAEAIKSAFEIPLEENVKAEKQKQVTPQTPSKDLEVVIPPDEVEDILEMEVKHVAEEQSETDNLANKLVEDFGQFDPTLELGN